MKIRRFFVVGEPSLKDICFRKFFCVGSPPICKATYDITETATATNPPEYYGRRTKLRILIIFLRERAVL